MALQEAEPRVYSCRVADSPGLPLVRSEHRDGNPHVAFWTAVPVARLDEPSNGPTPPDCSVSPAYGSRDRLGPPAADGRAFGMLRVETWSLSVAGGWLGAFAPGWRSLSALAATPLVLPTTSSGVELVAAVTDAIQHSFQLRFASVSPLSDGRSGDDLGGESAPVPVEWRLHLIA